MPAHRTPHSPAHRPHPPVDPRRAQSTGRWAAFVNRYGWRAYALPVLSALTVAALAHTSSASKIDNTAQDGGAAQVGTAERSSAGAAPASRKAAASRSTASPVRIEGLTGGAANFGAASTPAPVVIERGDDGTCATNRYRQLVLVSITEQHLWACQGAKQVESTAVTTGATVDHDETPLGSWRVQAKERNRYLVGPGYRDYVHYWVPFNGDFGLHDAAWQTMPFGSMQYRKQGSHGCVHVPEATMAWLYRWSSVDATVVTVEA